MCSLNHSPRVFPEPLLGGVSLHTVAGIRQLKGKFLPLKAKTRECVGATIIPMRQRSIVIGWRLQIHYMRGRRRHNILTLQNAHLYVRAAVFPLNLVFSSLQSGSIQHDRVTELQIAFGRRKGARGQHQSQP